MSAKAQTSLFGASQLLGDFGPYRISRGDAVEWLLSLPPESLDLVLTDPAYESLEKHRAKGTTTRLTNDWFEIFRNERFPDLFRATYRALKPNTHLYFMCDAETMFVAKPVGEAAGFTFRKPLVWDKKAIGMGYHYRARYELVLFFEKGERRLNDLGIPDVLEAKRVRHKGAWPTEKPVPLLRTLIAQSTNPGEVVADPFMGSGSTGEAALRSRRRFLGNDLSERSADLAGKRLSSVAEEVWRP